MLSIDGKLYRFCTWIYSFMLLNLLFIIYCIPIVTIFPATAALLGVVRQLVKKNEVSIIKKFHGYFVENFKQSFVVGFLYMFISLILFLDFSWIHQGHSDFQLVLMITLLVMSLFLVISIVSVFPLMVNSYYSIKDLFTNSLKFGFYKVHLTILQILGIIVILYFSMKFLFLFVFFTSSISAFITCWFAELKFSSLMVPVPVSQETSLSKEE